MRSATEEWRKLGSLWGEQLAERWSHHPEMVPAFTHDCKRLRLHIKSVEMVLYREPGNAGPVQQVAENIQSVGSVLAELGCASKGRGGRCNSSLISTPFYRPQRKIGDTSQPTVEPPKALSGSLRIATFGWWEIVTPNHGNVQSLCQVLAAERVDICCVTGLPAGRVRPSLQGSLGYCWHGPWRFDVHNAGFLLTVQLASIARDVPVASISANNRRQWVVVGELPLLAVYGPHVGKFRTEEHRAFLSETVVSFCVTCSKLGLSGWMLGDFNLQGIAKGGGKQPVLGTQHRRMSGWFRTLLDEHGLQALPSPPSHRAGGTLDIHIPLQCSGASVRALPRMPKCPSDHRIMVADTSLRVTTCGKQLSISNRRGRTRCFTWSRSEAEWAKALEQSRGVQASISKCASAVARAACGGDSHIHTTGKLRSALSDAVTTLIEALVAVSGHAAGLIQGGEGQRRQVRTGQVNALLTNDLVQSETASRQDAETNPQSELLAEAARVSAYWAKVGRLAHSAAPATLLDG